MVPLHVNYLLAGQPGESLSRRVSLGDLRLRLANGEVKVPHGGMLLLCQVDGTNGLEVGGRRFDVVGRAVLKGGVRTRTGVFSAQLPCRDGPPVTYQLPVAVVGCEPVTAQGLPRDAQELKFVVRRVEPADDPCQVLYDPATLKVLDGQGRRQELAHREGELTTEELVLLLGGLSAGGPVRFNSEGAIRSR